jgi:hypothetical protein
MKAPRLSQRVSRRIVPRERSRRYGVGRGEDVRGGAIEEEGLIEEEGSMRRRGR